MTGSRISSRRSALILKYYLLFTIRSAMCAHAKDPGCGRSSSSASILKKKSGTKVMTYQAQNNRPSTRSCTGDGRGLIIRPNYVRIGLESVSVLDWIEYIEISN